MADDVKPPTDGEKLLDHLAGTGTGAGKLARARAFVKADRDAGVLDVYAQLAAGGCGEVTLAKARKFLGLPDPVTGDGEPFPVRPAFPVRAPVGGCTVGDVTYAAGQIVPRAAVDAATADEVKALLADVTPTLQPVAVPPQLDPGQPAPTDPAPAADPPADPKPKKK